jgi:hypothetical protein
MPLLFAKNMKRDSVKSAVNASNIDHCCECVDPKVYCKFKTQCIIWEVSKDRRKEEVRADGSMG